MRIYVLLVAFIVLPLDMLAHPAPQAKGLGDFEACSDKELVDEWDVYHPKGTKTPDDRYIADGATLTITYDSKSSSYQAKLEKAKWQVISEAVFEMCGHGAPNAVMAMWIKRTSDGAPRKLCVEKVRSEAKKAPRHNPKPTPGPDELGIFMVGIDQPCNSYHGEREAKPLKDKMVEEKVSEPVTPGHSHADN